MIHAVHDGRGLIQVRQDVSASVRTLHFDSDIEQSRYWLNAPFTLGFEYLQVAFDRLIALSPRSLLSLGLGGGRLNAQLHYACPDCQQTVVELRPAVIEIARTWFDLPEAANLAVVCADAFEYVLGGTDTFDAAFVDLFDGEGMPPLFATPVFMGALLSRLRPKGTVLMNIWLNDGAVRTLLLPWLRTQPGLRIKAHRIQSSPNRLLEITLDGDFDPA